MVTLMRTFESEILSATAVVGDFEGAIKYAKPTMNDF